MKKFGRGLLAGMLCTAFCAVGCLSTEESRGELFVYMPDGAPAMALAGLMATDSEGDGVTYRVVAPATISGRVTYADETKNADFCVLPLTAASKLLGSGENYTMLGTLTHGNLYLLAKEGFSFENLSSLIGKKVGVLQINEVPGLTLKATLQKQGIAYQEIGNDGGMSATKVNLMAISGADAVGSIEEDCFLIAEPAATAQAKKGYRIVGDLQAIYGGEEGYPQAVLVAKNSIVEERSGWLKGFVAQIEQSVSWVYDASGEEILSVLSAHLEDETAASSLKAPLLSQEVVARCGIRFAYAAAEQAKTQAFIAALMAVNEKAAAMPSEAFFWTHTPQA